PGMNPNGSPNRPDRIRSFVSFINWDRAPTGGVDDLRLWDTSSGTERFRLMGQRTRGLLAVALSQDGRTLVAGGAEGAAWVWDLQTREGRRPLFLTGQARIAWGKWDAAVKLGAPMYPEPRARVWGVALSADGRLLAAASDEATAKLWELPSGRERAGGRVKPAGLPCRA